jgi:hypothetical protein
MYRMALMTSKTMEFGSHEDVVWKMCSNMYVEFTPIERAVMLTTSTPLVGSAANNRP